MEMDNETRPYSMKEEVCDAAKRIGVNNVDGAKSCKSFLASRESGQETTQT